MAGRWRRRLGRAALGLVAVVLVAAGGFAGWLAEGIEADPSELAAVRADPAVVVADVDHVLSLRPAGRTPVAGIVFYPGARIEREAYAATWAPIVERTGVAVFIPGMPLNLALLDRDRERAVRDANPDVATWFLGGHSMGGFAALDEVTETGGDGLAGLVLWAATVPPRDREPVPPVSVPTLTVAGELDEVVPLDAVERGVAVLGDAVELVVVAGMTHSQFGRYGVAPAAGGRADAETQAELTEAVSRFLLAHVSSGGG